MKNARQKGLPAGNRLNLGRAPGSPTLPILVLLVEFTDISLITSEAQWSDAFFGTTGKTTRTYYDEVSKGTFHFVAAAESYSAANDGIVKVALNYAHPNTAARHGRPQPADREGRIDRSGRVCELCGVRRERRWLSIVAGTEYRHHHCRLRARLRRRLYAVRLGA